ncbi:hypothetical protein KBA27_02550 [bacterium]|nr:hypothetical protein [bacterium]
MNIGNVLAKTAGVATLGIIAYDAHHNGKHQSMVTQESYKASSLTDSYLNTMEQESPSIVVSKYKKGLFNVNSDENVTGFFTGIAGYTKGFVKMLAKDVVPLCLALGTFAKPGVISKGSAFGLLGYGIICGIQNSGLTNPKRL